MEQQSIEANKWKPDFWMKSAGASGVGAIDWNKSIIINENLPSDEWKVQVQFASGANVLGSVRGIWDA